MVASAEEHPILFAGRMVRAILEGRKTQTRRVVKSPYIHPEQELCRRSDGKFRWGIYGASEPSPVETRCPFGAPGDRLWVRETWRADDYASERTIYAADGPAEALAETRGIVRWRPSIFMPRGRSRITLEVVAVRVERLQEISLADMRDEGFQEPPLTPGLDYCIDGELWPAGERTIRKAFGAGWDTINGKRAPWGSNPWVWAVTFKVAT